MATPTPPAPAHVLPRVFPSLLALWLLVSLLCPNTAFAKEKVYEATIEVVQKSLDLDCTGSPEVVALANGNLPGPFIEVEEGTRIIITFVNKQPLGLTIHWHGLNQIGTPWMDGVPQINQCPIEMGSSYTYNFSTMGDAGTKWWHAHSNYLRGTVHGAIIISPLTTLASQGRSPYPVPIAGRHILMLEDWYHSTATSLAQYAAPDQWSVADELLINGKSFFPLCKGWINNIHTMVVQPKKWYRIHVINAALFVAFNLAFQGHDIYTYEAEGGWLKPVKFSQFDILSGQSYQFLIYTKYDKGAYWFRASGLFHAAYESYGPALALMRYTTTPASSITEHNLPDLTGFASAPFWDHPLDQIKQTVSAVQVPDWVRRPDMRVVLYIGYGSKGSTKTSLSVNNVSIVYPDTPALFSAYKGDDKALNSKLIPHSPPKDLYNYDGPSKQGFGTIELPFNAVVELILQVTPVIQQSPHPYHLHGHNYYVVGRGLGAFDPKTARFNDYNPPFRNTEWVGQGEWIALRFRANNPGVWFSHCHLEPHADFGFAVTFHVKDKHGKPGIPRYPADYPTCQGRKLR